MELEQIYKYFKLYPNIYPGAYFRYLKATLQKQISNGTYIHRDGTYIGWNVRRDGTILLDKLVTSVPGRGYGKSVLEQFLAAFPDYVIRLKVLQGNKVAYNLYQKYGFVETDRHDGFVYMQKNLL